MTNAENITETVRFEIQERYPTSRFSRARAWSLSDYAKQGENARDLIFKTLPEARKEKRNMETRSARYGWGAEYRIVKTVLTTEVID